MSKNTAKITGTLVSLALVGGTGFVMAGNAAIAAPETDVSDVQADVAESTQSVASSQTVQVPNVSGEFSYDQNTLSTNEQISGTFNKAAASICNTASSYGIAEMQQPISVTGMVGHTMLATVEDLASSAGAAAFTLACACATNLAGGGAIANAEVEGISFESLIQMADVQ